MPDAVPRIHCRRHMQPAFSVRLYIHRQDNKMAPRVDSHGRVGIEILEAVNGDVVRAIWNRVFFFWAER